ncbi:MAG: hypothetical protein LC749_13730, partial [Actinobacteria bacterium]|nr:hypothetical protein [Actinomycetota bacterium]
ARHGRRAGWRAAMTRLSSLASTAMADAPVTHDFGAVAPDLGARANSIQESLERVDSVDPVADEVAALADALP